MCDSGNIKAVTESDRMVARLLVYPSLEYSSRSKVDQALFKRVKEVNFDVLKKLTDKEYSYFIRMALLGKSDSKYQQALPEITLYKVAGSAGIDVKTIEAEQKSKAEERAGRVKNRVSALQKRKGKLKKD